VITLQQLPPLPPYMHSSQAAPDKVLLILSVMVGGWCFYITDSSMCSFFFHFGGGQALYKVQSSLYPA
jgi:hypothetical protein